MKTKLSRIAILMAALAMTLTLFSSATELNVDDHVLVVGYVSDIDYMKEIVNALNEGGEYAIYVAQIYEAQRNLKIDSQNLNVKKTDFFAYDRPISEILEDIEIYLSGKTSGYALTDQERATVVAAVMAEAGGECYEGQMMIAQCILDGALNQDMTVIEFIKASQIVTSTKEPYDSCKQAVSDVFDYGKRVTDEMADIWYAPAICTSQWHESQTYITTIGSHKFFKKIEI